MRKSGGVVIPMKKNKIEYLFGDEELQIVPNKPFDEKMCDFLDVLSKRLREDKEARSYPDILTFAFWIRRANLTKMKELYKDELRLGKGLVFHIAPSNVPINFAYTLIFGLLSGNSNVVKASSKRFSQTEIVCRVMRELSKQEEYEWVRRQNAVVIYDREQIEYTEAFSGKCDVRVIWGGDSTIKEVRKTTLLPRSTEITFADRYSFAIIASDSVLKLNEKELEKLADGFYNDTYLMDQNACSTPHLICWMGEDEDIASAKELFWNSVSEKVRKVYSLEDIKVSDKYTIACEMAVLHKIQKLKRYGNELYVGEISDLPRDLSELRGKFGLFYEYSLKELTELSDNITRKVQTCVVFGVEKRKIADWMLQHHICGIDRVVDVGKTLDIGLMWDGYDVIRLLSRGVVI